MVVHTIGANNSLFNQFIAEIRNIDIQKDSLRFRRNLERVGEIFAYEISKTLEFSEKSIQTPLGESLIHLPQSEVVVTSIMRAGLPLHTGLLNYFDGAENAFISAYRKYTDDGEFKINFEYISSPSIEGKVVILADPMLATGSSMELAYKALLSKGTPKHVHVVSVIASEKGVEFVKNNLPKKNTTLWMGAIDQKLNSKSYIVPGCGDAGDLAFGAKLG
ncbi:uracil phosphoribosyltransferase [Ancylomarina longa]|uniref:Uracil phosphoribosyltransferase n=1 Tax=Ancylomarina longa TaxID=2487017 RepID=A0A434AGK0_9BACT|nr:uracil phosphoribosyltransferase [Ancylomarina longa]RUT73533.1 uracil phosphoribosyltransferase [Ancylomarina longa]